MLDKLKLYMGQVKLARERTDRFAQDHCMWFARMQETMSSYLDDTHDFTGVRALDLGCGLLQWQTIMLHSLGASVTGVDMEYIRADRKPDKYFTLLKTNGLERAVKTLFWDMFFRKRYIEALRSASPFPLDTANLDLRQHKANHLPFADNEFDLVVSHEVLEHIEDISTAMQEVKRVMKPGALAYINIHLFPSISGGHHVQWKYPDEEPSLEVPPWDHLRDNKYPEHPSWINKLREKDYKPVFEREFDILRWDASAYEGKALLTQEIRDELSDYTDDELLKKGVIVVARKPPEH